MVDAATLANPAIARLRAYDPGHDLASLRVRFGATLAELGANENPYGPGPAARAAMTAAMQQIHRYPDPQAAALRQAVAAHLGVAAECLVFGNGSHELLMQLGQCFASPQAAVMYSQYGFAVFAIAASAAGAPARCVEALSADHPHAPLGHDLPAMRDAMRDDVRLVYLANPNNPTGTWFGREALESFLAAVPDDVLVVVDEAYAEYFQHEAGWSAIELLPRFANLVVTRTFSKAHALAGLRVGYLAADPGVCNVLERVRESFNVNAVAQAAACASLDDAHWIRQALERNQTERAGLVEGLRGLGHACLPSRTNFLLVDCHGDAQPLERRLLEAGVIVRPMGGYGLPGYLRISVGDAKDNRRLLQVMA
ncbi:MAG: histidinol-phosphate transaminase [Rhodanobacteraceae bacterium]